MMTLSLLPRLYHFEMALNLYSFKTVIPLQL